MQATVASFDADTHAGTVVTDDGETLAFDASALADHVRQLRPGQRVFLDSADGRIDGLRLW
jgi:2-phospho-L-lactate guanylyltransferase